MENLIPYWINFIHQYGYLIIFLGTIVAGDMVILAAAFLASLGFLNIFLVIPIGLAGIVISDFFWYYLGYKSGRPISFSRGLFFPSWLEKRLAKFEKKFTGDTFRYIFLSKFIYGTRIMILIFAGHKKIPFAKFAYYDSLGALFWILLMAGLGYLVGFSWDKLEDYNSYSRYLAILLFLLLFVFRYIFNKIISPTSYSHEPRD